MKFIGSFIVASLFSVTSMADDTTTVSKQATSIVYRGGLTQEANEQAFSLLTPAITTLKISSNGGNILLGMAMGEWVHRHGLKVEVLDFCFSSCANYIFPAGKTKILGATSMLGWHGGATQKASADYVKQLIAFKPDEIALLIDSMNRQIVEETLFFSKIGVMQASTVYGHRAEFDATTQDCAGWTYSLEAMNALGMQNIELKDGSWSPPDEYKGKCIYRIENIQSDTV